MGSEYVFHHSLVKPKGKCYIFLDLFFLICKIISTSYSCHISNGIHCTKRVQTAKQEPSNEWNATQIKKCYNQGLDLSLDSEYILLYIDM